MTDREGTDMSDLIKPDDFFGRTPIERARWICDLNCSDGLFLREAKAVLPELTTALEQAQAEIGRLEKSIGDVAENAVELADRAERAEAENALLRVALDDLVGAIRNSSKGSMGAMNNVYLPQINIIWLEELYGRAVPVPKEQQG